MQSSTGTAASYLGSALGRHHEIIVINRYDRFLYHPSLVWVGVGHMKPERTRFPLQPVHDRFHVRLGRIRHGICARVSLTMDWQWPEETLQELETLAAG